MKKNSLIVPLLLAVIVLILVIAAAINHNVFKRTPAETLQQAKGNMHFVGPAAISSMQADKLMIIEIGVEKVLASFPSAVEIKSIAYDELLSGKTSAFLNDNTKKKILFAQNLCGTVKAWTFLTRMGYNELYVYDPDEKSLAGQIDSVLPGNEKLQYTFKPEKTESE